MIRLSLALLVACGILSGCASTAGGATPIAPATVTTPFPSMTASASPTAPQPTATPVPPTAIPPTLAPRASATPSLAYKLATIEKGTSVAPSDPLVAQMDSALRALRSKCGDTTEELAGYAVVIHNDMAKRGVEEGKLSILQHVADSMPPGMKMTSCKEVFAAYATLRLDG